MVRANFAVFSVGVGVLEFGLAVRHVSIVFSFYGRGWFQVRNTL